MKRHELKFFALAFATYGELIHAFINNSKVLFIVLVFGIPLAIWGSDLEARLQNPPDQKET